MVLFAGGFTGWGFAAFDCGLGVWIFGCFGYLVFWVLLVVGGLFGDAEGVMFVCWWLIGRSVWAVFCLGWVWWHRLTPGLVMVLYWWALDMFVVSECGG